MPPTRCAPVDSVGWYYGPSGGDGANRGSTSPTRNGQLKGASGAGWDFHGQVTISPHWDDEPYATRLIRRCPTYGPPYDLCGEIAPQTRAFHTHRSEKL